MKTTAFGRYLRKLRIDHGMIMRDLAKVLGVSSAFVSALELGKKTITEKNIIKITEYFELSNDDTSELRKAAELSQPSLKLELNDKTMEQRELAVSFARNYQNMEKEDQIKLMKLLEG